MASSSSRAPIWRRKRPLPSRIHEPPRRLSQDARPSQEEPFCTTVVKVGSMLLLLCTVSYSILSSLSSSAVTTVWFVAPTLDATREEYRRAIIREQRLKTVPPVRSKEEQDEGKLETLPAFPKPPRGRFDAYGIAETHVAEIERTAEHTGDFGVGHAFLVEAKRLRDEFAARYGGEYSARALLNRTLRVVLASNQTSKNSNEPKGMMQLAAKIAQLRRTEAPRHFRMAFAGNSAPAGYGNFHNQSYPYVAQRLLKRPFALLGLTLTVVNGAIHDIPTFPYLWCQSNHLGDDLDMVSWDFGPTHPDSLEAYIQHVASAHPSAILMFRDSFLATQRQDVIQRYVDDGVLAGPFLVDTQPAMVPYTNVKEKVLPAGFQNWKEFGGPPGAPGKVRRNLSLRQHELVGYSVAMHVLSSMELAAVDAVPSILKGLSGQLQDYRSKRPSFPESVASRMGESMPRWHHLLYPYERQEPTRINCRTSFDPVLFGQLSDVVPNGVVGDDADLLHPKGAMFYHQGWPIDLDTADRREKQLMMKWDNLGFRDYKKAYHGIKTSGPLRLFLPAGEGELSGRASEVFRSIVVCESHLTAGKSECNFQKDVSFTLGGSKVSGIEWMDWDPIQYNGQPTCLYMEVPENARLSSIHAKGPQGRNLEGVTSNITKDLEVSGLEVDIEVTQGALVWNRGPCSLSHVVWERKG